MNRKIYLKKLQLKTPQNQGRDKDIQVQEAQKPQERSTQRRLHRDTLNLNVKKDRKL